MCEQLSHHAFLKFEELTNENLPPPAGGVPLPADVVSPPPVPLPEEPSCTLPETKIHHDDQCCNSSHPIIR